MFCRECGTKLTGRTCPKCGTKLKNEEIRLAINNIPRSSTSFTVVERQDILKKLYLDSSMDYPELNNSDKDIIRDILFEAYINKKMPNQILKSIRTKIKTISREQAIKISNTERMKAYNLLNYVGALTKRRAKSFTVMVTSEGCDLCHKTYDGKIFDICQRKKIPPIHDECTCIPQFSTRPIDGSSPYTDDRLKG